MIKKIIEQAKVIIIQTNNFIHGIDHIVRVHELALKISNEIEEELTDIEKEALNVASYWHDIGRVDLQSYEHDYDHAENSAENLMIVARRFDMQDSPVITTAMSAIRNHRKSKGMIENKQIVDRILWDADKLDIFNTTRISRIVNDYKKNGNNGDYNLEGSIEFWNSIDKGFANNFHFKVSKEIFYNEFPKFKNLINSIIKEKEVN